MAGLVLTLSPGEKFFVNGALLENGEKAGRIRIKNSGARVLRCSDALRPNEVNTPVKQIYYAVQLLITGDLEPEQTLPAIDKECAKLEDVFEPCDPKPIPLLRSMIARGNYYSALIQMQRIFPLESSLLALAEAKDVVVKDQATDVEKDASLSLERRVA